MTLRRVLRDIEIWTTVVRSWIGLRLWPARELNRAFAPAAARRASDPSLVSAFRRATRAIARGRCLLLAVALLRLLRRRGIDATLRIGFAIDDDRMPGHAWVESNAAVQGDTATIGERFTPFNITAAGLAAFLLARTATRTFMEDSLES